MKGKCSIMVEWGKRHVSSEHVKQVAGGIGRTTRTQRLTQLKGKAKEQKVWGRRWQKKDCNARKIKVMGP